MKLRHYLLYAGICIALFAFYAVLRPVVLDVDSPAFLLISCTGGNDLISAMPLTPFVFDLLPCNQIFFKAVTCLILFLSIVILAKAGELFDSKQGWMAGFFAFAAFQFLPQMLKLEEQNLAFPFVFLSFYFLLKHIKGLESWKMAWKSPDLLWSIACLSFAGLFWKGIAFLLPMYALYYGFALLASIPLLYFWHGLFEQNLLYGLKLLWQQGFNAEGIVENFSGVGIISQYVLLLGLWIDSKFLPSLIYLLVLAWLSQKYAVYLTFFLAVGLILILKDKDFLQFKALKGLKLDVRMLLIVVSTAFLAITVINMPFLSPENQEIEAINELVSYADDDLVLNDWGYGWWIKLYGGNTKDFAGESSPDYNNFKGYALTKKDTTCTKIKDWNLANFQTLHLLSC